MPSWTKLSFWKKAIALWNQMFLDIVFSLKSFFVWQDEFKFWKNTKFLFVSGNSQNLECFWKYCPSPYFILMLSPYSNLSVFSQGNVLRLFVVFYHHKRWQSLLAVSWDLLPFCSLLFMPLKVFPQRPFGFGVTKVLPNPIFSLHSWHWYIPWWK